MFELDRILDRSDQPPDHVLDDLRRQLDKLDMSITTGSLSIDDGRGRGLRHDYGRALEASGIGPQVGASRSR